MNCEPLRERLPELLYGGLPPSERAEIERHLDGCAACRRERAALESLSHCLDSVPPVEARVDLPRLYREALDHQGRHMRRWRIVAGSLAVAAAVLLVVCGLRLEVRFEAHQLVLRWGSLPEPTAPVVARPEAPAAISAEEVQLLRDLIHALATDVEASERRNVESVVRLRLHLDELQRQTQRRVSDTERDVAALYTAHFGPRPKGEEP